MAEELGYFPVTDEKTGETVMVPAKAKRESTDQAIELAKHLQSTKAVMYGAFWCPHCSRQKELFGREAWKYITYVECSPKGYKSQYTTCLSKGIEGYPSWKFGNGKSQGGEMELAEIATISGFKKFPFDASLEGGVPSLGGGGCK
jgi:glutaredoxin